MLERKKEVDSENGVVHCVMYSVRGALGAASYIVRNGRWVDFFYHTVNPQYDRQEQMKDDCRFLGFPCYCDGITGDLAPFLAGDEEAIYQMLERRYHNFK